MNAEKVAVLYVSPDELRRFPKSEIAAPDGWQALVGTDGVPFFARPIKDGIMIIPPATFDDSNKFVLHLHEVLGPLLDMHVDLRGIHVITVDAAQGGSYQEATTNSAGEWIPRVSQDHTAATPGWSFADAARAFATPDARHRVDAPQAEVQAPADPIDAADSKFGAIFASRNERGALRRTLSAALDHSIDASLLGSIAEGAEESAAEESNLPIAGVIRRGISSDPKTMNALEADLRAAVDGGLNKDDSEKNSSPDAPAEDKS